MSTWIVSLFAGACGLVALALPARVEARAAELRVARVETPVAILEDVEVRLAWSPGASSGRLRVRARTARAPDLGYRFSGLDWTCPLRRDGDAWSCAGDVSAAGAGTARLSLALDTASTQAELVRGQARVALDRDAASPDLTRIDLTRVPVQWAQALASQAWPDGRFGGGRMTGQVLVDGAGDRPLQVDARLEVDDLAVDTPDGSIAAEGLGARLGIGASLGAMPVIAVDGDLLGGELLFGTTYVSLGSRAVALSGEARKAGDGSWDFSRLGWQDGDGLQARGRARWAADAGLDALQLELHSTDLGALGADYLSGWLGVAGLAELQLGGRADLVLGIESGHLEQAGLRLEGVSVVDPRERFGFQGLRGDLVFSSATPVDSELRWDSGTLYGLRFGAARLPFASGDGTLRSREAIPLAMLGGQVVLDDVRIQPPGAASGLDVRFGLALEDLDVAALSTALDWPPFTGRLGGRIPMAHYAADRLDFDGGLVMRLFDGEVEVSSLSMERPFGVAPTLSADIGMDGLDLEALTGVFGFGSISGRLHGRIDRLRLVNWTPVAFDAELHTERGRGVRQRISQRAVQDLSSVGDASFMGSLQGRLIGLFDDFRYSRIGIACVLADEVCTMDGLGSAGRGFIIVEGAGVPRLTVVGFNRRVDWPTLVERLAAIGSGDVAPVVE
ncbi:hypothetical protein [Marilutibacter spongiae]|uniref:Dicarboxylate transport domain-containing protein n=1 Tax=Marilutibacter spongiae TaxID=2025720 RepID=A0A7W3Y6E5_9GAMM|nr:hypothetical protein [Lysobacter spongiae]MBB1061142.1 hypothetical protein [Lysobacter spongiae]